MSKCLLMVSIFWQLKKDWLKKYDAIIDNDDVKTQGLHEQAGNE